MEGAQRELPSAVMGLRRPVATRSGSPSNPRAPTTRRPDDEAIATGDSGLQADHAAIGDELHADARDLVPTELPCLLAWVGSPHDQPQPHADDRLGLRIDLHRQIVRGSRRFVTGADRHFRIVRSAVWVRRTCALNALGAYCSGFPERLLSDARSLRQFETSGANLIA